MTDRLLILTEAARVLRVSPNTVRAWIDRGELEAYDLREEGDPSPKLRVSREQIAACLERRAAATWQPPRRRVAGPRSNSLGLSPEARSGRRG